MRLSGKVAVITGVGSGIGKALAMQLAGDGCHLALSDINASDLQKTVEEITNRHQSKIFSSVFDVSSWDDMQSFAQAVIHHFGHVDLVINNAGVALGSFLVEEVDIGDFEWLMSINFWGMVYGTKAFLPFLKMRPEGCLVNVSSILGLLAVAKQSPYCASKFAIRGFTESLRMEAVMEFPHVNILSVHPGGIQTNIAKNSNWQNSDITKEQQIAIQQEFEKSFINTPAYAAKVISRGIQKNRRRVLIGSDAKWMWRVVHWFPVRYTKIMIRMFIRKYDLEAKRILAAKSVSEDRH